MKFKYNDDTYIIEFQRTFKERKFLSPREKKELAAVIEKQKAEGKEPVGKKFYTKYPQTTVRLIRNKVNALPGEVFREATVGCNTVKHDKFTLDKGRVEALRKITPTLDKGFRHAMWTAYSNRFPHKG